MIKGYNPINFPEGSKIRSIYSNRVYIVMRHYKNGMCTLYCPELRKEETFNACNNPHFIIEETISLAILSLCHL